MRELRSEIEIDASPREVWAVLTDSSRHAEWNPFIRSIIGEPHTGARLTVRIHPPDGKAMTFKPKVLESVPNEELRWLGRLLLPCILDGEHIFEVRSLDDGQRTRFVQREEFRGVFVPVFWKSLNTKTRRGFKEMNCALKELVEGRG